MKRLKEMYELYMMQTWRSNPTIAATLLLLYQALQKELALYPGAIAKSAIVNTVMPDRASAIRVLTMLASNRVQAEIYEACLRTYYMYCCIDLYSGAAYNPKLLVPRRLMAEVAAHCVEEAFGLCPSTRAGDIAIDSDKIAIMLGIGGKMISVDFDSVVWKSKEDAAVLIEELSLESAIGDAKESSM